eukprot:GILJ01005854.1.p1 GENE.GILJ01005854.1~~GILJ01005854.1.p1  ORF type:complete len:183 (-),score=11.13 GILJ01005854.1:269-817(-)
MSMYSRLLTSHPLLTKSVTSGVLFAVGDVMAQGIEKQPRWNWRRTYRLGLIGGAFAGPSLHMWYGTLAKVIPSPTMQGALGRMALDQTFFATFFISGFFTSVGMLEGQSVEQIKGNLREQLLPTLKTNWMIWPGVMFLNFFYTPVAYQVLVVNTVALGWNTYLAHVSHKSHSKPQEEAVELS